MRNPARQTRENRTITVDFQHEATYFELLGDGKAFVELVMAFILAIGFQLKHKATCRGGGCLTRHSHYVRVRLGGISIWRLQCTTCRMVFTILPHFILRYRQMRPEVARDALLATQGGLSAWFQKYLQGLPGAFFSQTTLLRGTQARHDVPQVVEEIPSISHVYIATRKDAAFGVKAPHTACVSLRPPLGR